MTRILNLTLGVTLVVGLSACGTTYQLPDLDVSQTQQASQMFAEAQQRGARPTLSTGAAEQRFRRVAGRIKVAGEKYCVALMAEKKDFNCNVNVAIDREMTQRNAYFTYAGSQPVIRISMPLLRDTKNDDEVAFVLSHEYGHLIGRHIEKQQQQAVAGALILGTVAAAANSYSASYGGYYDPNAVSHSVELGAALGTQAYSQSYELESDALGARIATAAGYDAVKGAMFFARPEAAKTTGGNLSFWGTHPPDEKRLATVIATSEEIKANVGLRKSVAQ
ncbi:MULTISPECIES: M48 family metalloprotease [Rhodobacterales]|uniref:M48 family metalloprotease n=1 Tax=Rhodobacterales TaxID=204455 RepID=UPI003297D0AA